MPSPDNRYYEYRMLRLRQMIITMILIYFLVIILTFVLFFISPIKRILEVKAEILQTQARALDKIPNIEAKLAALEKQTAALTTDNVDARLARIEKAISVGEIKTEDISSLQEMRTDLAKLRTFMFATPEQLVEFRTIQKDYLSLKAGLDRTMDKDTFQREIDTIRELFYATLALVGILVSIFAGAWFVAFKKSTQQQTGVTQ